MLMARTPMWTLEREVGTNYFRARRTPVPTGSADDLKKTADAMLKAVGSVDRSHLGLLVDAREGPLRNDAEFESLVRPWQQAMIAGFARIAILVKTPAGKMQVERLLGGDNQRARVFTDEAAAMKFASSR
jgi:hypothetical protein